MGRKSWEIIFGWEMTKGIYLYPYIFATFTEPKGFCKNVCNQYMSFYFLLVYMYVYNTYLSTHSQVIQTYYKDIE